MKTETLDQYLARGGEITKIIDTSKSYEKKSRVQIVINPYKRKQFVKRKVK